MPTSSYFNNYNSQSEQALVESLVIESIRRFGYDLFYLPRTSNTEDAIFKEDSSAAFLSNYPIEMYIRSVDGFQGDSQFLSKFGIEIRHELTLTVAIRTFKNLVGDNIGTTRPLEGDLIYLPLDHKLLVIKNVDKYNVFFQSGTLQSYNLRCEVFEYGGEKLDTGIADVDRVETKLSNSTLEHPLKDVNGNLILDAKGKPQFDPAFNIDQIGNFSIDNREIAATSTPLIDHSEDDPLSEEF
jgi:hypothetical protein